MQLKALSLWFKHVSQLYEFLLIYQTRETGTNRLVPNTEKINVVEIRHRVEPVMKHCLLDRVSSQSIPKEKIEVHKNM